MRWNWPTGLAEKAIILIGCALAACRATREPGALGMGSCSWLAKPHHLPESHTYPAWVVDRALDFLKKRDPTTPFFLNLSIFSPHPPLAPSQAYFDYYDRLDLGAPVIGDWVEPFDGPAHGLNPEGGEQRVDLDAAVMHRSRAGYYGLIHELDAQLGRLLNALGGLLENTLILFTSDHGEMLGDHHLFGKCEPRQRADARRSGRRLGPRQGGARMGISRYRKSRGEKYTHPDRCPQRWTNYNASSSPRRKR